MSKNKKPTLFDLFNDDSLWGNQETDSLSHEEILDPNWTRRWDSKRKESHSKKTKKWYAENAEEFGAMIAQVAKDRVPNLIAISPEGKKHIFQSMQEAENSLGCGPFFNTVPTDGMPIRGERRNKKNWIFYRDIPNKNRNAELKRLQKIVKQKTDTTLKMPWRSSKWRATPEGQQYLAELEKRRNAPNKKSKKVMTPDGIFETNKAAADFYGITTGSFASRKRHNPNLYYNIEK